jgi:hypothetical protein
MHGVENLDSETRVHAPPLQVPESVLGGGHMSLVRALDVFDEFGISERKVGPCHVD